jgi:hypothetical protein
MFPKDQIKNQIEIGFEKLFTEKLTEYNNSPMGGFIAMQDLLVLKELQKKQFKLIKDKLGLSASEIDAMIEDIATKIGKKYLDF